MLIKGQTKGGAIKYNKICLFWGSSLDFSQGEEVCVFHVCCLCINEKLMNGKIEEIFSLHDEIHVKQLGFFQVSAGLRAVSTLPLSPVFSVQAWIHLFQTGLWTSQSIQSATIKANKLLPFDSSHPGFLPDELGGHCCSWMQLWPRFPSSLADFVQSVWGF